MDITITNAAELYKPICETCDERGEYTLATEDRSGSPLCSNCATSQDEAAYERMLSDFYGGGGPVTIREWSDRAYRERSELRRRD